MITVLGIAIVAAVVLWLLGGAFLRVGGAFFALLGAISLITLGNAFALVVVLIGFAMWLAGHWHFAVRHHEYKSPLARRIFLQALPPRLDPTRNWAIPVAPGYERGGIPEESGGVARRDGERAESAADPKARDDV